MASRSLRGRRAAGAWGMEHAARRGATFVRALRAHEHRTAALLLAGLVLVYLWPALVEGQLLSPTALLYGAPPWQGLARHGVERWINGDLGDVPYAYYPWDFLARRLIHAGTFPAWNPHAFAGTPLFANSQIAWLSPFSLPLWVLPLNYGLGVAAALKLWCAGFGTYLLARELRLGFWPAIVAGVAFALCSFNVVWLSYGVFVSVAAMLPWALWLVERIVHRGRRREGLALAGVLTVALTGGHPGTQVHLLAAVVLYALARAATADGVGREERLKRLATVAGGAAVALLLAAVVLLPAQEAATGTIGAEARKHGAASFKGAHMPFDVVRTALFPDWWGRPGGGVVDAGPAAYRERTFYAGAATLVLALVALVTPGAWRRKAPFAALGALGLAIAVRVPGLYDLVIRLPGFDGIQNSRIYLWFVFAAALLAGFGLQHVLDARARLTRGWIVLGVGLLIGLVVAIALSLSGADWSTAVARALTRTAGEDSDTLALASVLWWLLLVGALGAVLLTMRRWPRRSGPLAGLVALLVALDVLHFAHGYQPMGPADVIVPPRTGAIAYLQRHRDEGRIAGVLGMGADVSTLYGLRDVNGSDAPQPSIRFGLLRQLGDPTGTTETVHQITQVGLRVLGVLGARYIVLPPGTKIGEAGGSLRQRYAGRDATLAENRLAAPRVFVVHEARLAATEAEELSIVAEANFDPRRQAVVRADETRDLRGDGISSGSARIVAEENESVTLRATLARPGVVVLGDAWAPGWSVEVDGRPARAMQANVVLRGVAVPAGTHTIAWRYRVPGLRTGALLSATGLLAMLAWASVLVAGSRRRRSRNR